MTVIYNLIIIWLMVYQFDRGLGEVEIRNGLILKAKMKRFLILLGALLIVLSICGGLFAYTYTTNTVTMDVNAPGGGVDFVAVTANNTAPLSWTLYQNSYSATGNGTLFDISTLASDYTGDLSTIVYITNGHQLIEVYRIMVIDIAVFDSSNNVVDINNDGSANISQDHAVLTLKNGAVDLIIPQTTADVYTVKVLEGYLLAKDSWPSGYESPKLYCEVTTN